MQEKEEEGRNRTREQLNHRIKGAYKETGRGEFWDKFKIEGPWDPRRRCLKQG